MKYKNPYSICICHLCIKFQIRSSRGSLVINITLRIKNRLSKPSNVVLYYSHKKITLIKVHFITLQHSASIVSNVSATFTPQVCVSTMLFLEMVEHAKVQNLAGLLLCNVCTYFCTNWSIGSKFKSDTKYTHTHTQCGALVSLFSLLNEWKIH